MRKVLFWLHLIAGVMVGAIILVMSVTGMLLSFERQTLEWADRGSARVVSPPGAARLPMSGLIAKAEELPTGIVVHSDPADPVEFSSSDGTVYLNPYTGAVTGQPSERAHEFFESLRSWHRWIAMSGASQKMTEPVYDAANVVFLIIVISGPFLWWPKKLTWKHFRPIVWFRGGLSGKARDFNWHNAIGLWTSLPLLFIVTSGIVLSYPPLTRMLYRMAGTSMPNFAPPKPGKGPALPAWEGVDGWLAKAEARLPGWRTISLHSGPLRTTNVSVDAGTGGQPQKRFTLTLDRVSGDEVKWEPFTQNNLGFELRLLARFGHTGEVGGWPVQLLAGLSSLGAAVLVYTGIALSLRRLAAWRRRQTRAPMHVAVKV